MLKSINSNKILDTLSRTLPDDRPVTAIQIVESIDKCPWGFFPISRTHDQDQDADLWRDGSFLKRKTGRYLCLSKTEGLPDFVVQEVIVVNEKIAPPEGYSLLHRTADTEQKAWRKKQLCYRLVRRRTIVEAVTDIIVCNRSKKAPEGFALAGEINGVTICFKMGNVQDQQQQQQGQNGSSTYPNLRPAPEVPARLPNSPPNQSAYPSLNDNDHDYEMLLPGYVPARPAPPRPAAPAVVAHHTMSAHGALDGVPFILNPKFFGSINSKDKFHTPAIRAKTMLQLKRDYDYSFAVERQS